MKISDELEFAIIGLVILFGVAADELVRRIASEKETLSVYDLMHSSNREL